MAKGKLAIEISKDVKSNFAAELTKMSAKVDELTGKLKKTAGEGKKTGKHFKKSFGNEAVETMKKYAVGVGGVGTAVAALRTHYKDWLKDIKESSAAARQAFKDITAFMALQGRGEKAQALREAAELAAKFGIGERAEAFTTIQALQSARGGDLKAGMAAAGTVFQATRVGIPVDLGRELEVLGAAQGQKPGQALRRAYVAGQLSARDPATLARAAPGLTFWQDKDLGFAAAAVLAGGVRAEEVGTFTKAGGRALTMEAVPKRFQQTYRRLGVGDDGRLEKLRALADAGITTPQALAGAGLSEIRMQQALSVLTSNVETVAKFTEEIARKAKPGLLYTHRAQMERELPGMRIARGIDAVSAEYMNERAFGAGADPAMIAELRAMKRGLALRQMGRLRGWLAVPFHEESGAVYPMDWFRARMGEQLSRGGGRDTLLGGRVPDRGPIEAAGETIEREIAELLRGAAERMDSAAARMDHAAGQLSGGPTMVSPNKDE